MRPLLFLWTLMILGACTPSAEVTSGSSSSNKSINEEAPFIWKNKTFPKTMQISSDFLSSEETAIRDSAAKWKTATGGSKTWITFGAPTNNVHNIESPDGVMGVYKTTSWPSDVDDNALAITQLFGRRYNIGDKDEYVAIEHADILVNYQPGPYEFTFDSVDETPAVDQGYDLRTVVVHEMGHFLGLQHIPSYYDRAEQYEDLDRDDYKAISVMYPSISSVEVKREPKTFDINNILSKYPISSGASGAVVAQAATRYQPKNEDPGKNVKIVIELRKNGECVHKENGTIFKRHSLLKK